MIHACTVLQSTCSLQQYNIFNATPNNGGQSGKREEGRGKREEGRGKREEGRREGDRERKERGR